MNGKTSKVTFPIFNQEAPGTGGDFYLEIEPQGQRDFFRLPVKVKELAAEGVVLEVVDPAPGLEGQTLVNQKGTIHLAPDGFSQQAQLQGQVVWWRPGSGELEPSHYLLGLDLGKADFRSRRFLENLMARPRDISDLWKHWDESQTKPADRDGRIIFYLGGGALLGGAAMYLTLAEPYKGLANILTFSGSLLIAGQCLRQWWRDRRLAKGV
jgi:hypothetical protein